MPAPERESPQQDPVESVDGDGPLVLCQPHSGLWLPAPAEAALNERGRARADTDWRVDRLYDGLAPSASLVRARFHRYLVDANRDPSGASLYPGQNTTGLCPLTDFDGEAIYEPGRAPDAEEIERRRAVFHAPYHAAIERALRRAKARWGVAVLYDCHSIRSRIGYLFEGELPVFNIGTNEGRTCAPEIQAHVEKACAAASASPRGLHEGWSWVANGRFKGGWTTRRYGRPGEGVHAVQMELAQRAYMREAPPWDYDAEKAARLRAALGEILAGLDALARSGALSG